MNVYLLQHISSLEKTRIMINSQDHDNHVKAHMSIYLPLE